MIEDNNKTRDQLLTELSTLRQENAQLRKSEITQKQEEQALQESERQYRGLADLLPETIVEFDGDCTFTFVNLDGLKKFGYAKRDIEAGLNVFQTIAPEDHDRMKKNMAMVMQGAESNGNEYTMVKKDGSRFPAFIHSSLILRDDKVKGLRAVVVDITMQKRAEESLRVSERRYRRLHEDIRDGFATASMDGRVTSANTAFREMLGYSLEELTAFRYKDFTPEEWHTYEARIIMEQVIPRGYSDVYEKEYVRKDGTIIPVELRTHLLKDEDGNPSEMWAFVRDITDHKRTEARLRESEVQLRKIINLVPHMIFVKDWDGKYVLVNQAVADGYRATVDALEGKSHADFHADERELECMLQDDREVMTKGEIKFIPEEPYTDASGTQRFLQTTKVPLFSPGNKPAVLGVAIDITDRKKAEETLRENRAELDLALRSAGMGAWHWDIIENKRYFDDQVCSLLGIDPVTFTGTAGEFFLAVYPDDRDAVKEALIRTMAEDVLYEVDYRALWPDGSIHYLAARARLVRDETGRPVRLNGIIWDITSRKLAEAALKASLREKEILLKEIHHRVKNNLQVISSLLNMQSRYVREDVEAFRESMNRIKSMALVHDKLYRSEDLSRIQFPDYIAELSRELLSTYATDRGVGLDLHINPLSFDIDTAMPLGLIISELISNSLKHAFPESLGGTITIHLESLGDQILLSISDNGIGFPEGVDFRETPSLGMQLVVTLVEQLEGSILLNRDGGTEFRIVFPAAE